MTLTRQQGLSRLLPPSSSTLCLLLTVSVLLALPSRAHAQAAFVFSSAAVGGTAQVQTIPVTIQTAGASGLIKVLTQGSENQDFTLASSVNCPVLPGQRCNIPVSFAPRYPGLRTGAVLVLDTSGNIMASQSLSGVATGSLSVLSPGEINTLAGDGCLSDGPCPASGSTQATQSALNLPLGEATDGAGNVYVSDTGNNRIEQIDVQGNITVIAGSSEVAGFAGENGPALSAQLSAPSTIVIDGAGNILFADTGNNAIREINALTHTISTIAGVLGSAGNTGALLSSPQGFAFDATGTLYIADTGNNRIQKIDTAGNITTLAGTYNQPWSVAISPVDGSLYIADFGSNRILKLSSAGVVTPAAGTGTASYTGDTGLATSATLNRPSSVAVDAAGNLYIADSENNVIRKVNGASGRISTLAGNGSALFGGDGFNANLAGLYKPYSVSLDGAGDLLLADRLDLRVRKISATYAQIQYPTMKEGKTSAPIAQTLENDGNAPLNLADLTAAPATANAALDTNANDPLTTTCSLAQPLAVGSACVLAVEFTPVAVGDPGSGVLSVTSDSGSSPVAVDLTGTVLSVDPSSTTVLSSSNPAALNQGVTFTAKITSPNQVTGTVQFYDGATAIGTPQNVVSSSDTATLSTSFSTLGAHSITAVYNGDNLNAASTPNTALIETIQQPTTLNVVSSENPATQFQSITWTATLTGWTTAPSGNITFAEGSAALGSATLNGSAATTLPVPSLAAGRHTIVATFAGDTNDFGSQYTFVQTVSLAPTATSLTSSNTTVSFSTPVTFTATVTGVQASTPTGAVIFKDGASVLASVPVNSGGVASYVNSTFTAGAHSITAVYQGDSNYAASTSTQTVTETIQQSASSTALASSTTDSIATRPVTVTATVSAVGNTPTGSVNFMNGSTLLGTATLAQGVASIVSSGLPVGSNALTAVYLGGSNNGASTSQPLTITIEKAPTTTVVSSSQNPLYTVTPVVISATLANGGTQSPTGSVTFFEDSALIGTGTLSADGVATLSLPLLTAGSHTFAAVYGGDALDIASSSSAYTQTVQLRPTTDVLTSSQSSLSGGQQLTLISVIQPAGSAAATAPTGTVTFMSGSTVLATRAVDSAGVATVTVILPGTSATLTSSYNGDSNYAAAAALSDVVTIGPAPDFNLQVTPTTFQMQSKQHLALQVSLTSVKNFTDSFAFGCLGLPQNATCTFSQDKANLPSGGAQSVTLTVDTGNPLLGGTQARTDSPNASPIVLACVFPGAFGFGLLALRTRRMPALLSILFLVSLFADLTGLSGCGTIQNSGTPAGTYTFYVTATGQTAVSQSVPVTMTITQ